MKKIIYLFIIFGFTGLTSCNDQLELKPFNAIDEANAFNTRTDFNNAIKGVYASLRDGNYYGGEFLLLPDVISDNLILCSEGRTSYQDYYYFNMNGNIAWFNFFRAAYSTISRCNYILENIDNLENGDFKNNIEGQALALRAMAHFDLARVYCKPPQFANANDLGIAYVTSTDAANKPERTTVANTFKLIEDDFTKAVGMIATDNGTGFLNKAAVYGLMARFYLYSDNMPDAETAATNAIQQPTNTGVGTIAEFPDIWTDQTENGVLFKVINTNLDQVGVGVVYNQASPDGVRSEYVPDFAFYNDFNANDVRTTWFSTSSFAGHDFNHIVKYLQRPGSNQAVVDMKVLRWSEVYLIRAEARFNNGNEPGALADLNVVRSNRYVGFTDPGETGAALEAAIARQRRLELAFEGHRMFDLKRKNMPISRSDNGDYADGSGVHPPTDVLTLPASSPLWEMPIPQEELNANPNMQPNPSNG